MASSSPAASLQALKEADRGIQRLIHVSALLSWDQETLLPAEGVADRSEQRALLEGLIHARIISPRTRRHLERLAVREDGSSEVLELPPLDRAFLRELRRRYERRVRLPARLVTELTRATALAQPAWVEARRRSEFGLFAPHLARILGLVRETAHCLTPAGIAGGGAADPYDALLDEYEPWMKTAELERIFGSFREPLRALVERIQGSRVPVHAPFLTRRFPVDRQQAFSRQVLEQIGYDFRRGRLDESAHPFTVTVGASDVRLTTRYTPDLFSSALFGSIHEAGHGLYELGLAGELRGSLLADGTSLGMHESQSRLWENIIGRSLPFWTFFYPRLRALFPRALDDVDLGEFYRGVNRVEPSLIRVEADEVTYNLHILLRFRLERELLAGRLAVDELPAAWREESRRLLGVEPPDDASGVLQDIHWSMGSFGYFPTYALGNLYAAQLAAAMERDLPGVRREWERGVFAPVLEWLRRNVHAAGRSVSAQELCRRATGEGLDPKHFLAYLSDKYGAIYAL